MNPNTLLAELGAILNRFKESAFELLPNIVGAIFILLIGLLIAHVVRALVTRIIDNADRFIPNQKIRTRVRQHIAEKPVAQVVGGILYWIIIVFFLTAATETLGLPVVTTWLSGIAGYLPKILAAFMIGFAGVIGGMILRDLITNAAISANIMYAQVLGKLVHIAILLVTFMIAVEQIGINVTLLTNVINITIAALLFGGALAFGLGARTSVSNILASHYLQKTYKIGDVIKIGETEGRIIQITSLSILLESKKGQVSVPAKEFNEATSVLVKKGANHE